MVNLIGLAIPFFLLLIAMEVGVARWQGRLGEIYRWEESFSSLGCGVSSQVTAQILVTVLANTLYFYLYDHFRLLTLPSEGWPIWVGSFVAVDFLYYWWHRSSHRVNLLWAAHVVHHQSEDYNLAVALRQAIFTAITSGPFYWPLAFLGVPPLVFFICIALNTLYQFWIHTRLVGRLGPVEWLLNTPSHHRVHHGINPAYLDRNHAGVFILWDRLFGTFVEEEKAPTYGVVEGFPFWDPLWANLQPYAKLFGRSLRLQGMERLWVWFAPPEWRSVAEGGPVVVPEPPLGRRWNPTVSPSLRIYAGFWLVVSIFGITTLLLTMNTAPLPMLVVGGILLFWTTSAYGALLDHRPYAKLLEGGRLVALVLAGFYFGLGSLGVPW